MFFGQNVHMSWVSDGSKFIHLRADEIHCTLDSIHQSWLWIAHPCSTCTYSNIYSDADAHTQIAHTQFTREFLGGYFWAPLLFIIVVVVVVINMMITMMMTMTMTTLTPPTRPPPPASVVVIAIVITTVTLNHPPLHQHQESGSLLVGFAAKVWCMQQKYQPLHFLPSLQRKANKKFKFVTGNMFRLIEWSGRVTC